MRLLVTGGAGFIGSHMLKFLTSTYPGYTIVCADVLTYASNYELIADLEQLSNYTFEKVVTSGFISIDQVAERAEKLLNTSYGDYLNRILQSHGG